jgi:hypothetical protein
VQEKRSIVFWSFTYIGVALLFGILYIKTSTVPTCAPSLVTFSAELPFQYRVFVPAIVHYIQLVFPIGTWAAYEVTSVLSTFLIFWSFAMLLQVFGIRNSRLWALSLLYPLVWNYLILSHRFYPSDLLSIALFAYGLVCALRRKWIVFYIIFILGAFNRETILLLTAALFLFSLSNIGTENAPKWTSWANLAVQVSVAFAVKILLVWLFRNNPGELTQPQFSGNVERLVGLFTGDYKILGRTIACFGGMHLLIPFYYRWMSRRIRPLLWLIPIVGAGMFFVAILTEVRIYAELIPVIALALITAVHAKPRPQTL